MVGKYIKGTENTNADVISRLKNHVVDQIVLLGLLNNTYVRVSSLKCRSSRAPHSLAQ